MRIRRRFTVVIVGVVLGALLVAGAGTLILLRAQARRDTKRDVVQLAASVAGTARLVARPLRLTTLRTFLRRTQDISIFRIPAQAVDRLPRWMVAADLHPDALVNGERVSGIDGSTAYGVVPFRTVDGSLFAVAVTQPASRGGGATWYFLLSAGVALVVAAGAAEALAHRISRPLIATEAATRRIAAGDLSVRVPAPAGGSAELVSLTESVNTMAESLEHLRGMQRQFLLSVSHDLRTPLTSIRGFADALADGTTTDTQRAAEVIGAEARRLERLVKDLLDLARLDAHQFSLDVRGVDMGDVVGDTTDGFVPTAEKLGLTIVVHDAVTVDGGPTRDGLLVAADPDRLAQVMANLVENAMKFATTRIDVAQWYREASAQITVDDDGPGIAPSDLPRVFDRLWSRGTGRQVGTGLGLAIVSELVSAMGGSTWAEARPDGGTRMGVTLPLWGRP
jgi:signal transduction histidine kinase